MWIVITKIKMIKKNRPHRNDKNRPKSSYRNKIIDTNSVSVYIKQHLNNIWDSVHGKVKQHWDWVPKSSAYKKQPVFQNP